jgi:polyisoprenoid-binding protein YceI
MPNTLPAALPVRMIDGVEVPAPGRWRIDPGHAEVGFVGRHLMFNKVRGRFRGVDGFVQIGADPNDTTVEVTIETATVESGSAARDDHLRSPDYFDVEHFPTATFRGQARAWSGRRGSLVGDLTIKDVTRPVELVVDYLGTVTDPWGGQRAIFSARGTVNREDWGLTWNMPLSNGGLLVSKDIQLELELETVLEL